MNDLKTAFKNHIIQPVRQHSTLRKTAPMTRVIGACGTKHTQTNKSSLHQCPDKANSLTETMALQIVISQVDDD